MLLMMGTMMPETCWAVFERQAKNLLLIAASGWLIHLNVWRCTDLQTLKTIILNSTCISFFGIYTRFFFLWRCDPTRVMASSFLRFPDHTQRRTTVSRTPLDEWSARRRDLYLTTHDIHNRQISMPSVGFEPTNSAGHRPQTYALDRAATGTGIYTRILYKNKLCYWQYNKATDAKKYAHIAQVLRQEICSHSSGPPTRNMLTELRSSNKKYAHIAQVLRQEICSHSSGPPTRNMLT